MHACMDAGLGLGNLHVSNACTQVPFFVSFFPLRAARRARFCSLLRFPGRARIVWRLVASEGLVAADVTQGMRRGGA
jgi:hypothetical protein